MTAYTHQTTPTQFVEANGIRFAYRRFGKTGGVPLVFNQNFRGTMDYWDPAVTDGLAKSREVILFNNAGISSSSGRVPTSVQEMAANAIAFINALGLTKVDVLGFSIGGMIAQEITVQAPDLVRRLILVGTGPRGADTSTSRTAEIYAGTYDPPEHLWLAVHFSPSLSSQAAGRAFLKRKLLRKNRDPEVSVEAAAAQREVLNKYYAATRVLDYLKDIHQPTLIVQGSNDVIVPTVNSYILQQNLPNAQLILYPDSAHGSFYQYPELFVSHADEFLTSGLQSDDVNLRPPERLPFPAVVSTIRSALASMMTGKLRAAVLDDYQKVASSMADWSSLDHQVETVFLAGHTDDEDELARVLADYHILVVMRERTRISASLIERLPRLRLLVTSGMRKIAIDLTAAAAHGITVCGTASLSHPPVELTWALILGLVRNIAPENAALRSGGPWQHTVGADLAGKTLGILGLGRIGSRVARVGAAFDMDVLAWSQHLTAERANAGGARLAASKEELLDQSDVMSIHVFLSDRTRNLIRAPERARLRPTAYLVNTARAAIVDQEALIAALRDGRIAGAGLDVFDIEPLPPTTRSERCPTCWRRRTLATCRSRTTKLTSPRRSRTSRRSSPELRFG
ncbi:MAG TPA: alpha/beta fold hydrolase [Mycobacterium sp.]|nr:alpha/beta fold hydrolase [Mycobacterium sp.]